MNIRAYSSMKNPIIWSRWMDVEFCSCTIVAKNNSNLKGW